MVTFEVSTDTPMPLRNTNKKPSKNWGTLYKALDALELPVGGSFFVPLSIRDSAYGVENVEHQKKILYSTVNMYLRNIKKVISAKGRGCEEDGVPGVRVWRVK